MLFSIRNLRYLSPCSVIANIFEFVGLAVIAYYIFGSPLPRFDNGDNDDDNGDDDDDDDDDFHTHPRSQHAHRLGVAPTTKDRVVYFHSAENVKELFPFSIFRASETSKLIQSANRLSHTLFGMDTPD